MTKLNVASNDPRKCRNLRQLVKSYARTHKKKASYKERPDSLQTLEHTVLPSWLKAPDNGNSIALTRQLNCSAGTDLASSDTVEELGQTAWSAG